MLKCWIRLMLVWMLFPVALCGAERSASLFLKPTAPDVLAGIPVVVELGWTNATSAEVAVPPLPDAFWDHQRWTWISPGGDAWTIPSKQLHWSAMPQPVPVIPQPLAAGATISWFATVPAPETLKDGDKWTLRLSQRIPGVETRVDAEAIFTAAPSVSVEAPKVPVEAAWLQAALMESPREDVLKNPVLTAELWGILQTRAAAGDVRAQLVLFSNALKDNQKVAVTFQALEHSAEPARTLRDYLLLRVLERELVLQPNDDRALVAVQTPGLFMKQALKHLGKPVPQTQQKVVPKVPDPRSLVPVSAAEQTDLTAVLKRSMQALEALDPDAYAALLDDGFKSFVFTKETYRAKLVREFAEVKRDGGQVRPVLLGELSWSRDEEGRPRCTGLWRMATGLEARRQTVAFLKGDAGWRIATLEFASAEPDATTAPATPKDAKP